MHTAGLNSLYNYIPKEILPEEYGGNAGPIQCIHGELAGLVMSSNLFSKISDCLSLSLSSDLTQIVSFNLLSLFSNN